jgi:hypothetical protein
MEARQTLEQRLLEAFAFTVTFVREHPVFDRLLRTEPELLLPLVTVDGGPVLALYRALIAERISAEVKAGRAAPLDIEQAAEVIARLGQSLVLTREGGRARRRVAGRRCR